MRSIARKRRKWKVVSRRKQMQDMMALSEIDDIDVKVSLIQALIPVGLEAVNRQLQKEVTILAGEKHRHGKENVRWARQGGSVYLLDQKVPLMRNMEVPLEG